MKGSTSGRRRARARGGEELHRSPEHLGRMGVVILTMVKPLGLVRGHYYGIHHC